MKVGIIGLGYWGKIILNNLRELGYTDIVVCETQPIDWAVIGSKYKTIKDYKKMKCDKVFVLTPATTHYSICEFFLKQGVDVFCEKPLDQSGTKCQELYTLAENNKATLFVDWVFTYNPAVHKIKSLIKEWGRPTSIIANRMNYGPVREDVNARWDLASHDVSIACFLLDDEPEDIKWLDFKRSRSSVTDDSTVGILSFKDTVVQINASWHHSVKNRLYTIEFKDRILYWDDSTGSIICAGESYSERGESPLHVSINSFMKGETNSNITLQVTKILQK